MGLFGKICIFAKQKTSPQYSGWLVGTDLSGETPGRLVKARPRRLSGQVRLTPPGDNPVWAATADVCVSNIRPF